MRITGNKPVTGVQGRGSKKRTPGGEQFTPDTGSSSDVTQSGETTGGAGIQGIDALLALQEVDEKADRRKRAAKYGHSLLDDLEAVRADLLAGLVSEDRLELLARNVSTRPPSGEPAIDSVLEEIELRVKVELAKLGRFPDA
ncbi:MAG: flagellar assembly protein FliX [Roseibium sp.]